MFRGFPDLETKVQTVLNEGDLTVVRCSGVGTHEGDQMGVAPTRRKVQFGGIDIFRISGSRVVEHWAATNGLEVMHQI